MHGNRSSGLSLRVHSVRVIDCYGVTCCDTTDLVLRKQKPVTQDNTQDSDYGILCVMHERSEPCCFAHRVLKLTIGEDSALLF